MNARPSRRFWLDVGLSAFSALLAAVTLVIPDWIEAVFRFDPDRHSGALEWAIVAAMLIATTAFGLRARRGWRIPAPALQARR